MQLNDEELQALVLYQIGALHALSRVYNFEIEHVRPHGALYKQAAIDLNTSVSIAKAIAKYNPWLIYVGAAGEILNKAGEIANIRVAPEIHLDKEYNFDGTINFENTKTFDLDYAFAQLDLLTKESCIANNKGGKTKIDIKTIHLSMKTVYSIDIAKRARSIILQPIPLPATFVCDTGWV